MSEKTQNRIIEIDYQITAAAGAIATNNQRIKELIEANARHAHDIQKINYERVRLIEDMKP